MGGGPNKGRVSIWHQSGRPQYGGGGPIWRGGLNMRGVPMEE